jgi:hypothetical protein
VLFGFGWRWWLGMRCVGRVDCTDIKRIMEEGFRRDLVC